MKIALLTSSRADFGFCRPLLKLLVEESSIDENLIVFGTHLSKKHGYTVQEIENEGYEIFSKIDFVPDGDRSKDIAEAIGKLHVKFASFWDENHFDLVVCLGDRFEMFAAISASVPFNIPIAHISGGEETLGAIDNIYRHSLTLMSKYHFANTIKNVERIKQFKGSSENIFHTGSLAIDNINETKLLSPQEFLHLFDFNIEQSFVLFTFHPETVDFNKNINYSTIIKETLSGIKKNVLVTMPNVDTMGDVIREKLLEAEKTFSNITLVESLGSRGYYTALKHCDVVLGNSSSGIIEAASFSKYVVNIGNRQLGREAGPNVLHCPIDKTSILSTLEKVDSLPKLNGHNLYGNGTTAKNILEKIKEIIEN